ncbi:hypothetical protein [Mammaliicoccus phage vB_MscM-PMS3]|nr:hypothetical protein [Mammaliicoccus phage vB_MscM-PMS3]
MENNTLTNKVMVTNYKGIETVVTNWINSELDDYEHNLNALANDLREIGLKGGMVGDLIYYNQTTQFYKDYEQEIERLFNDLYGVELTATNLVEQLGDFEPIDDMDERLNNLHEQARDDIKADYPNEWDDMDELERDELASDYMDGYDLDELNTRDKNALVWLAFEHVAFSIFQAIGVE